MEVDVEELSKTGATGTKSGSNAKLSSFDVVVALLTVVTPVFAVGVVTSMAGSITSGEVMAGPVAFTSVVLTVGPVTVGPVTVGRVGALIEGSANPKPPPPITPNPKRTPKSIASKPNNPHNTQQQGEQQDFFTVGSSSGAKFL